MVDTTDLKSVSRKRVGVRVPSWAPFAIKSLVWTGQPLVG